MIPRILQPFKEELKGYQRECIDIIATPLESNLLNDPLEIQQSKFLGIPFLPRGLTYPKDIFKENMILLAQINFSEVPNLENFPQSGLLQLFISGSNWYSDMYKIIYHDESDLQKEPIRDFSFLKLNDYQESPISRIHSLTFNKSIDKGDVMDYQFDIEFNGKEFWDFFEKLSKKEQIEVEEYFDSSGHKIGGYSEFSQLDFREFEDELKNDVQLLQIGVDKHIMFGDGGVGHIFISEENLDKEQFDKAYFYWDCS